MHHERSSVSGNLGTLNWVGARWACGQPTLLAVALGSKAGRVAPPSVCSAACCVRPSLRLQAAPELLLGQPCTFSADIFSAGVLLWEVSRHMAVPS